MRWRVAVVAWWLGGVLSAHAGGGHLGAGACASPSCHGSPTARSDSPVALQNEYGTWRTQDRHAQAWTVLTNARSEQIAARLGIASTAAVAPRCLVCHGPAEAEFRQEGVGCEDCHGGAEGWIARHTERGWTHADSVGRGLLDLRQPAAAAARCLDCHLGKGADTVDHDLLAAGHPLLGFELDTFATNLPAHWAPHDANRAWFDGRAWVAGQSALLARVAKQARRAGQSVGWPDFGRYDCTACHHEINRDASWPLAEHGERAALDPWFATTIESVLRALLPGQQLAFREALAAFRAPPASDPAGADGLLGVAHAIARRAHAPIPAAALAGIGRDLTTVPVAGFRAAQQIAWGLDALAVATGDEQERSPLRAATGRLFPPLRSVVDFDRAAFAAARAEVRSRWR